MASGLNSIHAANSLLNACGFERKVVVNYCRTHTLQVQAFFCGAVAHDRSNAFSLLEETLRGLARRVSNDPLLAERLDERIEDVVGRLVRVAEHHDFAHTS